MVLAMLVGGHSITMGEQQEIQTSLVGQSCMVLQICCPICKKGSLDDKLVGRLGLTTNRMKGVDALFLYQPLFSMCNPNRSAPVLKKLGRKYIPKQKQSCRSITCSIGLSGGYGHFRCYGKDHGSKVQQPNYCCWQVHSILRWVNKGIRKGTY